MDMQEDVQNLEFYITTLNSDILGKENEMTKAILDGTQLIYESLDSAKMDAKFTAPVVKVIFNEPVHVYKVTVVGVGAFKYTDLGYEEACDDGMSDKEILDLYGITEEDIENIRKDCLDV